MCDCMCAYSYACMYVYICTHICRPINIRIHNRAYVHTYTLYVRTCTYVCTFRVSCPRHPSSVFHLLITRVVTEHGPVAWHTQLGLTRPVSPSDSLHGGSRSFGGSGAIYIVINKASVCDASTNQTAPSQYSPV